MLTIAIDKRQIAELNKAIEGTSKKLQTELKISVRAATKKTQSLMVKEITKRVKVTQKYVKRLTYVRVRATGNFPQGEVVLRKSQRMPLKAFKGTRATRKGVSYQIDKQSGRKNIPSAFDVPTLGGHFFKRMSRRRMPIVALHGPSPWGVFKVNNLELPTEKEAMKALHDQIAKRIKYLKFKRNQ